MLKALLLDVLQRSIGEYVKTDDRSLRLGLEGGHLELRDLEVRREAFDRLGLPFVVKAGYVGLLRIELPRFAAWRSAGAEPDEHVRVHVESAYLLVAPRSDGRGLSLPRPKAGTEARRDKQRALAAAEQLLRSAAAGGGGARDLASALAGGGLPGRLLAQLCRLASLSLANVHVRCEDEGALTGSALNMGLVLAGAELGPCPPGGSDEEDEEEGEEADEADEAGGAAEPVAPPSPPPAGTERLLRRVRVRGLRVYVEPHGRQVPIEFLDALGSGNGGQGQQLGAWFEQAMAPHPRDLALLPLSLRARLELRLSGAGERPARQAEGPPPGARAPRLEARLRVGVGQVECALRCAQYTALLQLLQLGTHLRGWMQHWAQRPEGGWPRDGPSARAWWAYACGCVRRAEARRLRRFRVCWAQLSARRDLRRRYARLHRSAFRSRAEGEELLALEDSLSVADILLFRSWPEADGCHAEGGGGGLARLWRSGARRPAAAPSPRTPLAPAPGGPPEPPLAASAAAPTAGLGGWLLGARWRKGEAQPAGGTPAQAAHAAGGDAGAPAERAGAEPAEGGGCAPAEGCDGEARGDEALANAISQAAGAAAAALSDARAPRDGSGGANGLLLSVRLRLGGLRLRLLDEAEGAGEEARASRPRGREEGGGEEGGQEGGARPLLQLRLHGLCVGASLRGGVGRLLLRAGCLELQHLQSSDSPCARLLCAPPPEQWAAAQPPTAREARGGGGGAAADAAAAEWSGSPGGASRGGSLGGSGWSGPLESGGGGCAGLLARASSAGGLTRSGSGGSLPEGGSAAEEGAGGQRARGAPPVRPPPFCELRATYRRLSAREADGCGASRELRLSARLSDIDAVLHAPALASLRAFLLQPVRIRLGLVKALLSRPRYEAVLKVGALRLLWLDQAAGARPRLCASLSGLHASGSFAQLRAGIGLRLACGLEATHCNGRLGAWEPLLEPWGVQADATLSVLGSGWLSAEVRADQRLELNLTHALCESLVAHLTQAHATGGPGGEEGGGQGGELALGAERAGGGGGCGSLPDRRRPFLLHNSTGLELHFARADPPDGGGEPGGGEPRGVLRVPAGGARRFHFWTQRSAAARGASLSDLLASPPARLLSVALPELSDERLCVRVDAAGVSAHVLNPRPHSEGARPLLPARLVVLVEAAAHGARIRVASALRVSNACPLPVRLLVYAPALGRELQLSLPAGGCCWLPAPLCADPVLRLRPDSEGSGKGEGEGGGWAWCAPLIVGAIGGYELVQCKPERARARPGAEGGAAGGADEPTAESGAGESWQCCVRASPVVGSLGAGGGGGGGAFGLGLGGLLGGGPAAQESADSTDAPVRGSCGAGGSGRATLLRPCHLLLQPPLLLRNLLPCDAAFRLVGARAAKPKPVAGAAAGEPAPAAAEEAPTAESGDAGGTCEPRGVPAPPDTYERSAGATAALPDEPSAAAPSAAKRLALGGRAPWPAAAPAAAGPHSPAAARRGLARSGSPGGGSARRPDPLLRLVRAARGHRLRLAAARAGGAAGGGAADGADSGPSRVLSSGGVWALMSGVELGRLHLARLSLQLPHSSWAPLLPLARRPDGGAAPAGGAGSLGTAVVCFRGADGSEQLLGVAVHQRYEAGGQLVVSVYAPYALHNLTGLPLSCAHLGLGGKPKAKAGAGAPHAAGAQGEAGAPAAEGEAISAEEMGGAGSPPEPAAEAAAEPPPSPAAASGSGSAAAQPLPLCPPCVPAAELYATHGARLGAQPGGPSLGAAHAFALAGAQPAAGGQQPAAQAGANASAEARAQPPAELAMGPPRLLLLGCGPLELLGCRLALRVGQSEWSRPLTLRALGPAEAVSAQRPVGADGGGCARLLRYELAASVRLGRGPFWRTKVLRLDHRTVVANGLGAPLLLAQPGADAPPVRLGARERCGWHWPGLPPGAAAGCGPPLLCVKLLDSADGPGGRAWEWSAGFRADTVGEVALKLRRRGALAGRGDAPRPPPYLARASVRLQEGGVHVVTILSEDASAPPFILANATAATAVRYAQRGVPGASELLPAGASAAYAFDEPGMPPLLELSVPTVGVVCTADLSRVGLSLSVRLRAEGARAGEAGLPEWLHCSVELRGPSRALVIRDTPPAPAPTPVPAPLPADAPPAPAQPDGGGCALSLVVRLGGVGLSVLDGSPTELLYASARGLSLGLSSCVPAGQGQRSLSLCFSLDALQLDSQTKDARCPVLLAPTPLGARALAAAGSEGGSGACDSPAAALLGLGAGSVSPRHVSFGLQLLVRPTLLHVRSLQLALRESELVLDEQLLERLCRMGLSLLPAQLLTGPLGALAGLGGAAGGAAAAEALAGAGGRDAAEAADALALRTAALLADAGARADRPTAAHAPLGAGGALAGWGVECGAAGPPASGAPSGASARLCVDELSIGCVALNVTLLPAERGASAFNPLASLLGAVGVLLGGVQRAPVRLPPLALSHAALSAADLGSRLRAHYTRAALLEGGKLLGYSDLLGSPAGLLASLGVGVREFVAQPVTAAAAGGSAAAVGAGLLRGTASLLRYTLAGTATATSRISASLGKGLAALSMDGAYIQQRNARLAQNPASDRRPAGGGGVALGRGLLDSGLTLGRAFVQGAAGVIQAPLEGAQRDGLRGAMQGVARGLVGAAVKPAAGVLELAQRGGEALRQATADGSGAGAGARGRVRPRRAGVRAGAPLPAYDQLAASLGEVLEACGCGEGEGVLLYACLGSHTLLFTHRRVLCLRSARWEAAWAVAWEDLISVQLVPSLRLVSLRCRPQARAGAAGEQPGAEGGGCGAVGYSVACEDEATCRLLHEDLQALLRASREGAHPFGGARSDDRPRP